MKDPPAAPDVEAKDPPESQVTAPALTAEALAELRAKLTADGRIKGTVGVTALFAAAEAYLAIRIAELEAALAASEARSAALAAGLAHALFAWRGHVNERAPGFDNELSKIVELRALLAATPAEACEARALAGDMLARKERDAARRELAEARAEIERWKEVSDVACARAASLEKRAERAEIEQDAILALRDLPPGAPAPEGPGEAYAVAVKLREQWESAFEQAAAVYLEHECPLCGRLGGDRD